MRLFAFPFLVMVSKYVSMYLLCWLPCIWLHKRWIWVLTTVWARGPSAAQISAAVDLQAWNLNARTAEALFYPTIVDISVPTSLSSFGLPRLSGNTILGPSANCWWRRLSGSTDSERNFRESSVLLLRARKIVKTAAQFRPIAVLDGGNPFKLDSICCLRKPIQSINLTDSAKPVENRGSSQLWRWSQKRGDILKHESEHLLTISNIIHQQYDRVLSSPLSNNLRHVQTQPVNCPSHSCHCI